MSFWKKEVCKYATYICVAEVPLYECVAENYVWVYEIYIYVRVWQRYLLECVTEICVWVCENVMCECVAESYVCKCVTESFAWVCDRDFNEFVTEAMCECVKEISCVRWYKDYCGWMCVRAIRVNVWLKVNESIWHRYVCEMFYRVCDERGLCVNMWQKNSWECVTEP